MGKKKGTNSIRTELIWSHIFIACIPFILISFLGIIISINKESENANQYLNQTVNQISTGIDASMTDIIKSVNMMAAIIEESDPEYTYKVMERFTQTHEEIAGILYAGSDESYVTAGMSRISRDSFLQEEWYKTAVAKPGQVHILSTITGRNVVTDAVYATGDVFSLSTAVKNSESGVIEGVLLFDIRHSIISDTIWDSWISSDGFVFVMDENNNIVYAPVNDAVYRIKPDWLVDESKLLRVRINNKNYNIRFKNSEETGWKVVGVVSTQEFMSGVYRIVFFYMLILVITLIIVTIISLKFSNTITRPVVKLSKLMKQTELGDFSVRFEDEGDDEIQSLGLTFNHMLQQIQGLMNRIYEEEEEKRQAQLKILQEQFKPHFLYNTLDTINWMARENGAIEVVKLVDSLTNMFRISLSNGNDYVQVSDEIKYISSYLYIQKTRYGTRLDYSIDLDEACSKVMIPKLILQPLVENAIYHGVKLKRTVGHLMVKVQALDDNDICLIVEDDGAGMSEEQLNKLRKMMLSTGKKDEESFGMYYVRERLRLRYGDRYRIDIYSKEEQGTIITIIVPSDV